MFIDRPDCSSLCTSRRPASLQHPPNMHVRGDGREKTAGVRCAPSVCLVSVPLSLLRRSSSAAYRRITGTWGPHISTLDFCITRCILRGFLAFRGSVWRERAVVVRVDCGYVLEIFSHHVSPSNVDGEKFICPLYLLVFSIFFRGIDAQSARSRRPALLLANNKFNFHNYISLTALKYSIDSCCFVNN